MSSQNYGFIPDGYYFDHLIEAEKGFHADLNIKFRPMVSSERLAFQAKLKKLKGDKADEEGERVAAEMMVKHLSEWDLERPPMTGTDEDGPQPVPITADNILRLNQKLSLKLFNAIFGDSPIVQKEVEDATKN